MKTVIISAVLAGLICSISAQTPDCTTYDADVCAGVVPAKFIQSPAACTNWIKCEQELLVSCGVCPDGLWFDSVSGGCTYQSSSDCGKPCKTGDKHRVPVEGTCSDYLQCFPDATFEELSCAEGLNFNPTTQQCDLPANAPCDVTIPFECPDPEAVMTQEPNPNDCTSYFICVLGEAISQTCLDDMHFDPVARSCREASKAGCSAVDPSDPDPDETDPDPDETDPDPDETDPDPDETDPDPDETDPDPDETDPDPDETDPDPDETDPDPDETDPDPELLSKMLFSQSVFVSDVQCSEEYVYYILSYPGSCQHYIQCIYGVPNVMNCADDTLFNPETLRCELSDNVACPY